MELDDGARASASALQVCRVEPGGLPAPVPFADGRYDLVCLLDVLEHIADDGAALARVCTLLKPGGRLLVTAPAYRWLWSAHDSAHHHHRRYTAGNLRQRAAAAGLQAQRVGYFNTLLFPPIALARGLQRLRGTGDSDGSDATLPSPVVNRLLEAVFAAERWWLPHAGLPFGVSVLGVFSRPA